MNAFNLARANRDLSQAFEYYESEQPGLGERFIDEFRRAVDRIIAHPSAWSILDGEIRKCRLNRFPYGVIYKVDEPSNRIYILAVAHLKRHPDHWRS